MIEEGVRTLLQLCLPSGWEGSRCALAACSSAPMMMSSLAPMALALALALTPAGQTVIAAMPASVKPTGIWFWRYITHTAAHRDSEKKPWKS